VVSVDVTVDEAYAAARLTAIHTLGMLRDAVASLDNVVSQSRALRFVVCPTGCADLRLVPAAQRTSSPGRRRVATAPRTSIPLRERLRIHFFGFRIQS
jgi:hypothetical protein